MSLKTDVVIVAYYGQAWLFECVSTLAIATQAAPHLILVDNGETSGNLENLPRNNFDTTIHKTPVAMGFAEANNFGMQHISSESEAICFLNQDTRSGANWLDACTNLLRADSTIGAISPLLSTYDQRAWDAGFLECIRDIFPDFEDRVTTGDLPQWVDTGVVTAAAMVVRTEALLKAGPFDPIYGSYYEDYDLCRRIRAAGYRVGVCTSARVAHYSGSATTTEEARQRRMRQIIRNRAILNFREAGSRRTAAILHQFGYRLPYNLLRGLARTKSSQPPRVQLAAHWELLRYWRRISSEKNDTADWIYYLHTLGWPWPSLVTAVHAEQG